jgi:6-pyruvoyl-tetrahydropterin synthase
MTSPLSKSMQELLQGPEATPKTSTNSFITVSIEVAGMHRYPESKRVYLRDFHRHDFRITVMIGVSEHNRQFEFYDVQDSMILALDSIFTRADATTYNFGNRSCEHIANELMEVLRKDFPIEEVHVFEDQYNGSVVRVKRKVVNLFNHSFGEGGVIGKRSWPFKNHGDLF